MDRVAALECNAVMEGQYKKDMKYARVQMEMTKDSVREMIDSALTPEIRKFLPQLISKLDELNAFESRLVQIRTEQNQMGRDLQNKILKNEAITERAVSDVRTALDQEILKLNRYLDELDESVMTKLKRVQEDAIQNRN